MFCEAYIEIAGWISQEPLFTCTKDGVPYCKFVISTTNNTSGDDNVLRFNCFLWSGQQYNLLKQLNLTIKDEVAVKGMFSASRKTASNGMPITNLQCYVNYIKVIRSQAAERAREQLNGESNFTNIPVKQSVYSNKNKDLEISTEDMKTFG